MVVSMGPMRWVVLGSLGWLAATGLSPSVEAQERFRYPVRSERIHLYPFPAPVVRTESDREISGRLRDGEGQALAGVDVVFLGLGRATVTDAQGRFGLPRTPSGTLEVHFRRPGYELTQRTIVIDPNLSVLEITVPALGPSWCAERRDRDTACRVGVTGARAAER
jgi:hypothetical protein